MTRWMIVAGLLLGAGIAYAVLPDLKRYLELRAM